MRNGDGDFEWKERHNKVFSFIDRVEEPERGVPCIYVTHKLSLSGRPGFVKDALLEEACFDLFDEGFLEMDEFAVFRVAEYPDGYEDF